VQGRWKNLKDAFRNTAARLTDAVVLYGDLVKVFFIATASDLPRRAFSRHGNLSAVLLIRFLQQFAVSSVQYCLPAGGSSSMRTSGAPTSRMAGGQIDEPNAFGYGVQVDQLRIFSFPIGPRARNPTSSSINCRMRLAPSVWA